MKTKIAAVFSFCFIAVFAAQVTGQPVINVTPDSLSDSLFTGDTSTHIVNLSNTGGSDLEWSSEFNQINGATLIDRDVTSIVNVWDDGENDSLLIGNIAVSQLTARDVIPLIVFESTVDKKVLFDGFHSNWKPSFLFGNLASELTIQSYIVEESTVPLNTINLNQYDILVIASPTGGTSFSSNELTAIDSFVSQGGGLFLLGEGAGGWLELPALNAVGNLFEVNYSQENDPEDNINFSEHEITDNVSTVFFNYGSKLSGAFTPLGTIGANDSTVIMGIKQYNLGRIVFYGDCNNFDDQSSELYVNDNLQLATNIFHWLLSGPDWLIANPVSGTITPGSSIDIEVTFDATGLIGGDYNANFAITSNDPINPEVIVPVYLHVTGAPDIAVAPDSLDYGSLFIGASATDTVVVKNIGTDLLVVSNVSSNSADFVPDTISFDLNPGEEIEILVTFSPSVAAPIAGLLTITSNDPDLPSITVVLRGQGLIPPDIAVSPDSLVEDLFTGESSMQQLTISNTAGGSDLLWEITTAFAGMTTSVISSPIFGSQSNEPNNKDTTEASLERPNSAEIYTFEVAGGIDSTTPSSAATNPTSLESILDSLNSGFAAVTGIIPNRYDFSNGVFGNSISDGGNDMYDGGNFLSTNLGGPLSYSDNVILNSAFFGSGGRYFTRKYPGLFVMAADIQGLNFFQITGNLGADGFGNVDGAILETTLNGITYRGFVKRVYNAIDPSVNHLIIVEEDPAVTHEFSTNTNDDYHRVFNLTGVTRIYYLLYAGANGFYLDNNATLNIMNTFINTLGLQPAWVSASPNSGTLPAGNTQNVDVTFDASGLNGGDYFADILISSNDPDEPEVVVPTHLHVTGAPDIAVSPDSLDYGSLFIGASAIDTVLVENIGTDLLVVSNVSSDNADFVPDTTSFTLVPGADITILVSFIPSIDGLIEGLLTFTSNDPDMPSATVVLRGQGLIPPDIAVSPDSLDVNLFTGEMAVETLTVSNTGFSDLDFDISIISKDSAASLSRIFSLTEATLSTNAPVIDRPKGAIPAQATGTILPLTASLADLTGKRIGLINSFGGYPVIIADLQARGAVVVNVNFPITSGELDSLHVLAIDDAITSASNTDISTIRIWLESGNGLLLQADDGSSMINLNSLLSGTGISETFLGSYFNGVFSNILAHPTTEGVLSINASGYGSYCTVVSPAQTIVFDNLSRTHVAVSRFGTGRVIAVGNEFTADFNLSVGETRLFANQVFDWLASISDFLSVEPTSGTIPAGSSLDIEVTFDAAGLNGGDYFADILISSNDPDEPEVRVPVQLHVTGAPDIAVSPDSLDYGTLFIGASATDTVVVKNTGTDLLVVSNVSSDNADFVPDTTSFTLSPGEEIEILVTFAPSVAGSINGLLTLFSNDPDMPVDTVVLRGQGLVPPDIAVSPDSLDVNLFTGEMAIETLTVSNTGLSDLNFEISIEGVSTAKQSAGPKILLLFADITSRALDVRSKLFATGVFSIVDTMNVRFANPALVQLIEYDAVFTWSVSSFFNPVAFGDVLADYVDGGGGVVVALFGMIQNPSFPNLLIEGRFNTQNYWAIEPADFQLGPQATLETIHVPEHPTIQNVNTFDGGSLSVRTVGGTINPSATLIASWSDGEPLIAVRAITGTNRVDLGFFPGSSDALSGLWLATTDGAIIMANALNYVAGPDFVAISPTAGTIPAGSSIDVEVTFDATGLNGGDYLADLLVKSNDPDEPEVLVPVHLQVTGAPDIVVAPDFLDYGTLFIGASATDTVVVKNIGTDLLVVSNVSSDNADFVPDTTSFSLNPGEETEIVITFAPSVGAPIAGLLTITSNDPDMPIITVVLQGQGLIPPEIDVDPVAFTADLLLTFNPEQEDTLTISNRGGSDLNWQIFISLDNASNQILYTLNIPASTNDSSNFEETSVFQDFILSNARPFAISEYLDDLTGVNVLFDEYHLGFGLSANWSTLISDLQTRGAIVTVNSSPITSTVLEDMDVVWAFDMHSALWTTPEINALNNWLVAGGGLLIESDQYVTQYNTILTTLGSGILYSSGGAAGYTTRISPHQTTIGVDSIYLGGPLAQLSTVTSPAALLISDILGTANTAYSRVGTGRIVVMADENFGDFSIGIADNQLFGNQVFDWLASKIDLISVSSQSGTIVAGSSTSLLVTIDGTGLQSGDYSAILSIESNDPITPKVELPVDIHVLEFLCGDANSNGVVDQFDLEYLFQTYFYNGPATIPANSTDLNCNDIVDLADIIILSKYLNGSITIDCCNGSLFSKQSVSLEIKMRQ